MVEDTLTIHNDMSEIRSLSKFAGLLCEANGMHAFEHRLTLVLEELFTNVVKYGYDDDRVHEIIVRVMADNGVLTASMEDDGRPFNPGDAQIADTTGSVEERPIGGLGIHLIFTIVDSFEYERVNGLNRSTITIKTPA